MGASNISVSTSPNIGAGKANTAAILAADPDAGVARACVDYRGGGKDDWFLPSEYEITLALERLGNRWNGDSNLELWCSSMAGAGSTQGGGTIRLSVVAARAF